MHHVFWDITGGLSKFNRGFQRDFSDIKRGQSKFYSGFETDVR